MRVVALYVRSQSEAEMYKSRLQAVGESPSIHYVSEGIETSTRLPAVHTVTSMYEGARAVGRLLDSIALRETPALAGGDV